jgi:hypothetical protein
MFMFSGVKLSQPLNPAALVVPPTPPAQFPHQVSLRQTIPNGMSAEFEFLQ